MVTPEGHRERRVGDIFKNLPSIRQFQIVQTRLEDVTIRLVVEDTFGPAEEQLIRRRVALWISGALRVDFDHVDRIEPGPSGKLERISGLLSDER